MRIGAILREVLAQVIVLYDIPYSICACSKIRAMRHQGILMIEFVISDYHYNQKSFCETISPAQNCACSQNEQYTGF